VVEEQLEKDFVDRGVEPSQIRIGAVVVELELVGRPLQQCQQRGLQDLESRVGGEAYPLLRAFSELLPGVRLREQPPDLAWNRHPAFLVTTGLALPAHEHLAHPQPVAAV